MKKLPLLASTLLVATAMAVPAFAADLTWGGSDGSWTGENVWSGSTWTNDDNAIFTSSGEGTVTVTGTVTAGSVTIEEGGSYTFAIDENATLTTGTLTNSGSLAITGSGKIVTGTGNNGTDGVFVIDASNFTGTLEITSGRFDLVNSTVNTSATLVFDANGTADGTGIYDGSTSIHYGTTAGSSTESASYTLANNIVISGESGCVILRSGNAYTTITLSGSVTGGEGTTLQLNGGGNAIFTGTVNLGTYINYQGSTTFSGTSTTIGTLELASNAGTATSVTFSGSSTGASVTSLTTEAASVEFTDSLTVSDGATLTVGSVSLSSTGSIEVTTGENSTFTVTGNITTSGGTLSIGEGSTVTGTGSGASYAGISGAGTFAFSGASADTTFTFSGSDFTGTLEVVKGTLDTTKVTLTSSMTVVMDANGGITTSDYFENNTANAILSNTADTTFAANLEISGTSGGGVIIRAGAYTTTFTGTVTGIDGTTLQLNGGGAAIFTNTVTLAGTYINFQGTTTFSGETVTIGELDINQNVSTTSAVIFDGSTATVGTLNIENHGDGDASTEGLTVKNGASLEVKDLVINHDIAIAIDKATLSITNSASGDKSANITISNGGQLSVGTGVTLNVATMEIILGVENVGSAVSPDSLAVTLASSGVYALTGEGTITTSDAAIKITVDDALAELLAEGGEYTLYIYDSQLSGLSESNFDYSALADYGITWNGDGTITLLPEPELFSIFFGLGAIGLVATRRRRRVA